MSDRTGCNGLPDYAIITWLADAERVTAMKKKFILLTINRGKVRRGFETGSTKESKGRDLPQCHPLFTGCRRSSIPVAGWSASQEDLGLSSRAPALLLVLGVSGHSLGAEPVSVLGFRERAGRNAM